MTRIGIIFTPDNANDADFWRWTPAGTTLLFTRTPLTTFNGAEGETWTPTEEELVEATRSFVTVEPAVTTFACTSGSFAKGLAHEEGIRATMERAGATIALTTAGSVLDALAALGARTLAVATPYDDATTERLGDFLRSAGLRLTSLVNRQPKRPEGLTDMTIDELTALAIEADRPDADALFISCTALATFDLIGQLEASQRKPVITAAQATMWAALGAAGVDHPGIDQALFGRSWERSAVHAG